MTASICGSSNFWRACQRKAPRRAPGTAGDEGRVVVQAWNGVAFRMCFAGMRQTLQGSFSAVSKPNFARKYAFESSRRYLHNALLCTAPKSHFLPKCCFLPKFCPSGNRGDSARRSLRSPRTPHRAKRAYSRGRIGRR